MLRLAVIGLTGLVLVSSPVMAEELPSLPLGARIRIRFVNESGSNSWMTGILEKVGEDGLALSGERLVPLSRVSSVETSKGHRRRWRAGALVGGLVGTALSLYGCQFTTVAMLSGNSCGGSACVVDSTWLDGACVAGSVVVFTGAGALVGLAIKQEQWGVVSLEPQAAPGGAGALVRVEWR